MFPNFANKELNYNGNKPSYYWTTSLKRPTEQSALFFAPHGGTAPNGHGLIIMKASRSSPDTPQSTGPLCTSDQAGAEATHNTRKTHAFMTPADFEPAVPVRESLQTHSFDRATTAISSVKIYFT